MRPSPRAPFPEWEFGVQAFDEGQAEGFDFRRPGPDENYSGGSHSHRDGSGAWCSIATPSTSLPRRSKAAFHPGHLVPGIDFHATPRFCRAACFPTPIPRSAASGKPIFTQSIINRPRWKSDANLQRDGMRREWMWFPESRPYEPNSLDPSTGPRENPQRGFRTFAAQEGEAKSKGRSCASGRRASPIIIAGGDDNPIAPCSAPEQRHIQKAFAFELSKVETPVIRSRMA